MKKAQVVTLLKAMQQNTYDCAKSVAETDKAFSDSLIHECIALDLAISVLTDDNSAKAYWDIYFPAES